jgi:hypothetical protein
MSIHQTAGFIAAHFGAIARCEKHPDCYTRAGDTAAGYRAHESAAESCAAGAIGYPEKALHEAIDDVIRSAPTTCELCASK